MGSSRISLALGVVALVAASATPSNLGLKSESDGGMHSRRMQLKHGSPTVRMRHWSGGILENTGSRGHVAERHAVDNETMLAVGGPKARHSSAVDVHGTRVEVSDDLTDDELWPLHGLNSYGLYSYGPM